MTITNMQTEAAIIEAEKVLYAEREAIDATLKAHARDRRLVAQRIEAKIARGLHETYQKALAVVQKTETEIASRTANLQVLTERQKAGDRSVRATDLRSERDEIESLQNYLISDGWR